MDAGQTFNHMLSDRVRPWARQHGFVKHGPNFTQWAGTNCKVISFQKQKESLLAGSGFHLQFQIYAGVFYRFLHEFESPDELIPKYISHHHCQWWQLLGFPDEKRLEKPWVVYGREPEEDNRTGNEIIAVLERDALRLLTKYSGEEYDLAEVWGTDEPCRTNRFFGNGQRLRYLAIYLLNSKRLVELEKVLMEIRTLYQKTDHGKLYADQFINKILEKSKSMGHDWTPRLAG